MNKNRWILAFGVLLVSSLACSVFTGGAKTPATPDSSSGGIEATTAPAIGDNTETPAPTTESGGASGYNTKFPLPADISDFTDMGNGTIKFQTKMSLKDAIAFYREAFSKAGYKERTINTAITDATFSMVLTAIPVVRRLSFKVLTWEAEIRI